MLVNVVEAWKKFQVFEGISVSRIKVGSDNQLNGSYFLAEFDSCAAASMAAGCPYSDILLAFKLLEKCIHSDVMSEKKAIRFLSSLYEDSSAKEDNLSINPPISPAQEKIRLDDDFNAHGLLQAVRSYCQALLDVMLPPQIDSECEVRNLSQPTVEEGISYDNRLHDQLDDDDLDGNDVSLVLTEYESEEAGDTLAVLKEEFEAVEEALEEEANLSALMFQGKPVKRLFPCGECEYIGRFYDRFRRHCDLAHKMAAGLDRSCPHCEFTAATRRELNVHKRLHHEKNLCAKCQFVATTDFKLLRHMRDAHGVTNHICDQCDKSFLTGGQLKAHNRLHHDPETKNTRHVCEQCGHLSRSAYRLHQHRTAVHEGALRRPCPDCDHVARTIADLRVHILREHKGVRFNCDSCQFSGPNPRALKRHKEKYHEGIRYKCAQCEYFATDRAVLRKHVRVKHEGVRHPCNECEMQFCTLASYRRHKESVHQGLRFPCVLCGFRATQKGQLSRHLRLKHDPDEVKKLGSATGPIISM